MRRMLSSPYCELSGLDLEELIVLPVIQERTQLWFFEDEKPAGFAFVDEFNNLVFGIEAEAEEADQRSRAGRMGAHRPC